MNNNERHWSSTALVLMGMWLWREGEYGHALLCMHAPQWGYKIGTQLSITWGDVLHYEDHECYVELNIPDKDIPPRPISYSVKESIEKAFQVLDVKNWEDSLYMNYKTGKPLTSSTLNRELQRFSEKFLAYIKKETGRELNFKPLKSNAFEIAWALDTVKAYHYSKQAFIAVSKFMGHRTVKDTIELLEVEPNDTITFKFNYVKHFNNFLDTNIFDNKDILIITLLKDVIHEGEEFIPII